MYIHDKTTYIRFYSPISMDFYAYVLLYACMNMHIGVLLACICISSYIIAPQARRVTHDSKEAMQNYQI